MESSVKFVRGSHRWGQWFHPRKFATEANYPLEAGAGAGRAEGGDKVFADVPVAEIESGQHEVSRAGRGGDTGHCTPATVQLLGWAAAPGDCVVFHGKTLHGAAGNSSTCTQRRVLSTRWVPAELARSS